MNIIVTNSPNAWLFSDAPGVGPMGDWDHVTRMDHMGKKADRVPAKTDATIALRRTQSRRRATRVERNPLKRLRVAKDRAEFDQFMVLGFMWWWPSKARLPLDG